MTTPRFERRNAGSGHSYKIDGYPAPGVTTVLNALAKPALVNWAARTAAEHAINDWDRLSGLSVSERLKEISGAHRSTTRKAATRGTRIHTFGEQLAHGEISTADVPPELAGPVQAYAHFLDEWQIVTDLVEVPVAHLGYRYCGTLDLIANIPRLGHILLDVKTGSGVWPETALQLAAYRHAEVMLLDGVQQPMGPVQAAYVAHVLPDSVELVPVNASPQTWKKFLHLLQVYQWQAEIKDEPPIGRAIHPENVKAG